MSALPEQAVDPLVLDHITQALGLVAQHGSVDNHPCGCRWNDLTGRWHLCRYHDGMNDGLAMAAAADPTPRTTCIYCNTPITGGIDGCWHDDNGREVCPGESPTTFHEVHPPTPTPQHCPTCGSTNRDRVKPNACEIIPDAWHDSGGS